MGGFCGLSLAFWAVLGVVVVVRAKTAPEFTVTVDTDNFKEIRIPFGLWKKIITRNYDPDGKLPLVNNTNFNDISASSGISSPILHEVVLNVVVPPEAEAENAEVDLELATQQVMIPELNEETPTVLASPVDVLEAPAEVLEAPVEALEVPALVKPQSNPVPLASGQAQAATPLQSPGSNPGSVLVQTARFPCTCDKGICGCCTSFFSQKGCANIGFLPEEFAFEVKMTMNDNVLARRKLPVSDPPPICFNPRRAPFLELCAQLNNIHFKNRNVHVCVDIDANVGGFELFSWNYNCLKFGTQGLQTGLTPQKAKKPVKPVKPEEGGLFDLFGGGGDADGDDEEEGGFFDDLLGDDDDF